MSLSSGGSKTSGMPAGLSQFESGLSSMLGLGGGSTGTPTTASTTASSTTSPAAPQPTSGGGAATQPQQPTMQNLASGAVSGLVSGLTKPQAPAPQPMAQIGRAHV